VTSLLDRYNLRPQEKRLVVVVGFVLFVVVNLWFVWPHFHDWAKLEDELAKARHKLSLAREEIGQVGGTNGYEAKLKRLESAGTDVLPEEQAIKFAMSVEQIARQSGITVTSVSQVQDSTDAAISKFFVEKSLNIGFENTEERVLVNFLYNLGTRSSMFRVKDLSIKPQAGQYRLSGQVTLIASYLKDPGKAADNKLAAAPRPALAAKKPAVAAPKPGAPAPGKPSTAVPGKGPLPIGKPGLPGGRPGFPGTRAGLPGGRPMMSPTNSHSFRPPSPASKQ
jgi:hypothetical protein